MNYTNYPVPANLRGTSIKNLLIAAMVLVFGFAMTLQAQETSGDLVGTVKDTSGAVIVKAEVVVTNEDTNVATTIQTGSSGQYHAANLLPGKYDIAVTGSGFQPYTLRGVSIELNKTSTSDITLSVGASTTVEVTADAGAVLDTTTTNLTTTFSNTELSNLPSSSIGGTSPTGSGQSGVLNVALLSPGVASSGGLGIGSGPSIGGQRPRNNNFAIEGIDNNNKAVTGPLVYVPNDAVSGFTLITTQFSPDFGHSSGGQFNTNIVSGTNKFHGKLYEYFQNRNLNSASGIAGGKIPNPKFDDNRYGGQIGGPVIKDKLFFFANFERNTIGQNQSGYVCVPTAGGIATINGLASSFSATNLQQYLKYMPLANYLGGAQVNASNDNACFNETTGLQTLTVTDTGGTGHPVALGNYQINAAAPILFDTLTTSGDYTITSKDSLRMRYIHNWESSTDTNTGISLPVFYTQQPFKYHLIAISEFHVFTPNLTNEFRIGYNRYSNTLTAGNFTYPGLDAFPTFQFYDQDTISMGPDTNAPQFTIFNTYQATDNVSYIKGKHTFKIGFDGRKYISPQGFTQRARGDYEYVHLDQFLHDLAPDANGFAERSTGNHTYYGDQTAFYGYANDTWHVAPKVVLNFGLRYEFTSVPVGERAQQLNSAASAPGLVSFHAPQPTYTALAPRFGVNWSPDEKTSVRAGFGIAYDVLFDNLGTLSFPPQYSSTEDVGSAGYPAYSSANFLKNGGLPPGKGTGVSQFCVTGTGPGTTVPCTPDIAAQRAATSAYLPNQILPYSENYTLTIQHTFGTNYTAEIGYVGTRGVHLPTQDQINVVPPVTTLNQLPTFVNGNTLLVSGGANTTNLGTLSGLSNIVPAWNAAGFTGKITSYQPYSESNYNGLVTNLTRRFQKGLQMNLSYTWSKTMDDATDETFATVLTPRREQNSQCIACDYSRSALDRTNRFSLEVVYDVQAYKTSHNFLLRNVVGNWLIAPIYTYESPEYATVLSGVNSNLNGDSGAAIDRANINPHGVKGTGTGVVPLVTASLQSSCSATATSGPAEITGTAAANGPFTVCQNDTTGYSAGSLDPTSGAFTPSNAYYVEAGPGTAPTGARNTLPIRPIDNLDVAAYKRITVRERYSVEVGVQAFNTLNHPQYQPGSVDNVSGPSYTSSYSFQTVTSAGFNRPDKEFLNNARTMQLTGKITF
jgi:Carboxypeptidase regulatory-like domain